MTDILAKITAYKREEVAAAKARRTLAATEAAAREAPPVRPFAGRYRRRTIDGGRLRADRRDQEGVAVEGADPRRLRSAVAGRGLRGGRRDLPVGADRRAVVPGRAGVPDRSARGLPLPALRKDFMIDPYQVPEARSWGADCILIIMAQIDDALAATLAAEAERWGMDAIVEVHDEAELERALKLPCRLIGINNRNLKTFETTLATTERLAPRVPKDRIVIGESGIFTHADLQRLSKAGVNAFLVGESLMRQADVAAATRKLLGGGA